MNHSQFLLKPIIFIFDEAVMNRKIMAIKAHASQLDSMFPSFDQRPFWKRAYDRNKEMGTLLNKLCTGKFLSYAEVFKKFSSKEFIHQYSQEN